MPYREIVLNIGQAGINLLEAFKYIFKGQISFGDTAIQIKKAGPDSVFIVSITSMFIGLAMSTQLAKELAQRFGAEHLTGGLIGVAVIRELAPVITSIVVAGRVGASISAEIGSMKTSEQIDALSVLGIDPIKYLLVPRLLAVAIISPLLTILSAILAILAGMVLTNITVNLSSYIYLNSVRHFIEARDVFIMMFKSVVFGSLISVIATTTGLQITGGDEAVGNGVTHTVVWSIILIFVFNYLITSIFFG